MSIHEMIAPAVDSDPLWNLFVIAEDLVSSISKFTLVFTVGFIGLHITIRIIRSLISKYYRTLEDPEVIEERLLEQFRIALSRRPREEVDQLADLLQELIEMPDELRNAHLNRGLERIFDIRMPN